MQFKYNDGGRSKYFKGDAGDCVVRAIAIATNSDYKKIYYELKNRNADYLESKNTKLSKALQRTGSTPRQGNYKKIYHDYILSLGFKWTPTMFVGQGCKVHLIENELPKGTLIVSLSRHLCTVINGVINDTFNPQRQDEDGRQTRCVYGFYQKEI